ncbi:MAG: DUF4058 family protein [Chloroflexota bacterium]
MPSPFPGMDPYLEERSLWPDVHQRLITYISEVLQPQVPPKYIARIGERVELAALGHAYIPDVMVIEPPHETLVRDTSSGVLVADAPLTFLVQEEERRIPYLEIVYRESGDVVTVIEVLSPANKTSPCSEPYLQKQENLLSTWANIVEIDLLSYGQETALARIFAARLPDERRYMVSTVRRAPYPKIEVYPIGLQDTLPRCQIPLRPADPDVVLDLAAVFTRCYDIGGYDLLIDYSKEPPVSLGDDGNKQWADELLRSQGLR